MYFKNNPLNKCLLVLALFSITLLSGCDDNLNIEKTSDIKSQSLSLNEINPIPISSGTQGFTYERLPDGSIGPKISSVKITFMKIDSSYTADFYSDAAGYYKADLPIGSYYVVSTHPDYEIYQTYPGKVIVSFGYSTFNVFLEKLTYGFTGFAYERKWDGSIGDVLPFVKITFQKDDNLITKTIFTTISGYYKVSLPIGKYIVTATKGGYYDYSSSPGYFVVTGTLGYQTGNFFLRKKLIIVPL